MTTHPNSILAHRTNRYRDRHREILEELRRGPGSDRDLCCRLGFTDMNAVRPRITELVGMGAIVETGEVRDPLTHKTVRVVALRDWGFVGGGDVHEGVQAPPAPRVEPSPAARDAWRMCARGNPVVAEQLNLGF
jgi:hypothetical protein